MALPHPTKAWQRRIKGVSIVCFNRTTKKEEDVYEIVNGKTAKSNQPL